jgi:hypothetical protein
MHLEGLTDLRSVNYMRLPLQQLPLARPGLPRVRRAERSDLQWLEYHLRGRGEVVRLLADDLLAYEAELPTLGARYASFGLQRGRTLFVVDGDHAPLGFALAEEGTPGLSWAEMTTTFSLVIPDPLHARAPEVREALALRCAEHYRELGKVSAVGLVQDDEVEALVATGYRWQCRMSEWTFHRSTARTWHTLMAAVFERLKSRSGQGDSRPGSQAA